MICIDAKNFLYLFQCFLNPYFEQCFFSVPLVVHSSQLLFEMRVRENYQIFLTRPHDWYS